MNEDRQGDNWARVVALTVVLLTLLAVIWGFAVIAKMLHLY